MKHINLSEEKFKDVYNNEEFRNQVAFAHGYANAKGELQYKITCSHPVSYRVTERQIIAAKQEREKAKRKVYKEHKQSLLFVGMGMEYEARFKDDVCNHRIRTEFLNSEGKQFFIEFGRGREDGLRIDHSINRTLQKELNNSYEGQGRFYNWRNLERNTPSGRYTTTNILKIVNQRFNCNFKTLVVDNYNIHCSDQEVICISPKK